MTVAAETRFQDHVPKRTAFQRAPRPAVSNAQHQACSAALPLTGTSWLGPAASPKPP